MKTTRVLLFVGLFALAGCGKSSQTAAVGSPSPAATLAATIAPTPTPTSAPTPTPKPAAPAAPTAAPKQAVGPSSVAGPDRVSADDGGAKPDGNPDVVFSATLSGQIDNIVVTVCDNANRNTNHHWDTFTGNKPIPSGFQYTQGNQTWVIGVADGSGKLINRPDGSMARLNLTKPTPYKLHAQNDGSVVKGARICLTTFRPDGSRSVAATTVA